MKSIKVNSKQLESEVKQLMFDFFKVEITEKTDEQLLEYAKQCRFYRFPFTCITPENRLILHEEIETTDLCILYQRAEYYAAVQFIDNNETNWNKCVEYQMQRLNVYEVEKEYIKQLKSKKP